VGTNRDLDVVMGLVRELQTPACQRDGERRRRRSTTPLGRSSAPAAEISTPGVSLTTGERLPETPRWHGARPARCGRWNLVAPVGGRAVRWVVPFDLSSAYDELNAADHDYRFYADLARELCARSVLDLGCGTGTLARLLAADGCEVVAIDPDPDMLRVAREKASGLGVDVDWRLGDSGRADTSSADLALMTGHVAQVFVNLDAWSVVLRELRRALKPGGTLAFETRNPVARA